MMNSPSTNLAGRRALVTGASRGIGRAIAIQLARAGADVAVNFLSSQQDAIDVAKQIDALGRRFVLLRGDVSKQQDAAAMVDSAAEEFGGLDIVVSNAAAGGFRPLMDVSPVNFEATLRTNSLAALWLAQSAAEFLAQSFDQGLGNGKFIAISSHGSQWAVENYGAIGASKAALEGIVRHLALELGPRSINCNCVLPGIIATDAVATMPGVEGTVRAAKERMMMDGRDLTPEDVAGVVEFLCGRSSDLIQGQTLIVDGGVSIRV